MILANTLRRKIAFLKRSLLPSAVLGGFLVLIFNEIWKLCTGNSATDLVTLESLTYHCLGLGFIALSWRHLDGVKGRKAKRDVFNTSTVTVGGYLIQGIAGLLISLLLYYLLGNFAAEGILLPMGFGQGPGQAFNWGNTYENQYGFVNGASFGLTVAAVGFIAACVGGLFYLNKVKGKFNIGEDVEEHLTAEDYCSENEIPVSESMDKLTVQFCLVFLTYAVTYGSMWVIYKYILNPLGGFALGTINPLLWGFNFLVGVAWTMVFKSFCNMLRRKELMHREYTNNFMLNRISGLMFDIMVVASIAAINLSAFKYKEFWIPLLLICVAGTFVTFRYVRRMCQRLFPEYSDEMFLVMYGMLTGTASTGIILLREVDPLYKTPASHNLIYQNLWAIVLGAPMLMIMGIIPKSITHTWVCLGFLVLMFLVILVIQFRDRLFRRKK